MGDYLSFLLIGFSEPVAAKNRGAFHGIAMFTCLRRYEFTGLVRGAFRDGADAGTEVRPVSHWIQLNAEHSAYRER
jgi:hypothetical protein